MSVPQSDRPNPLTAVAAKLGPAWAALIGVITALVPLGILSQTQVDTITTAGEQVSSAWTVIAPVIGGVIAAILAVVQAFTQAKVSKNDVTPTADPRNDQGQPLTPPGL